MVAGAITAAVLAALIAAVATVLVSRLSAADTTAVADAASQPAPSASPVTQVQERTEPAPPPPSPSPEPEQDTPKVATNSARLEDVQAQQALVPTSLDVEAIGIADAPIDAVGVEPDGSMEIPVDVSRIGWYEYGPEPGADAGSSVLTAHVDSRTQGAGVFYDLDDLAEGDTVEVGMSDGTTRDFVVDEIGQIPKVDLPTGDIFRRDGEPRLALITCGGEFDESSRHYRDNLVVFAAPVG